MQVNTMWICIFGNAERGKIALYSTSESSQTNLPICIRQVLRILWWTSRTQQCNYFKICDFSLIWLIDWFVYLLDCVPQLFLADKKGHAPLHCVNLHLTSISRASNVICFKMSYPTDLCATPPCTPLLTRVDTSMSIKFSSLLILTRCYSVNVHWK